MPFLFAYAYNNSNNSPPQALMTGRGHAYWQRLVADPDRRRAEAAMDAREHVRRACAAVDAALHDEMDVTRRDVLEAMRQQLVDVQTALEELAR